MIATTLSPSIVNPSDGSLTSCARRRLGGLLVHDTLFHDAPVTRGLIDRLGALDGRPARLFVHVLAVAELRLDDVDLLDVLQPRRPLPGADGEDAPDDLRQPLQHDQRAGDG